MAKICATYLQNVWSCLLVMACALPLKAQIVQPVCKNAFSYEQEQTEGAKVAAEVYQEMPVLKDTSPVSTYVRALGAKLVQYAPGYQWNYNFHVVSSAEINAFALPGGAIFVNLGTIQAAENEAQLAGVMAHEISHVVLRHSTCNLTKQRKKSVWYSLGQVGGAALGGVGGAAIAQGIGYTASLDFLHMSRDAEKQADLLGVEILYDAGYDPHGMAQFFEIILAKYGSGGSQMLSDHPNPGNRTEYVNAAIAKLPARTHEVTTSTAFTKARAEAAAIKPLTTAEVKAGAWKTSDSFQAAPVVK